MCTHLKWDLSSTRYVNCTNAIILISVIIIIIITLIITIIIIITRFTNISVAKKGYKILFTYMLTVKMHTKYTEAAMIGIEKWLESRKGDTQKKTARQMLMQHTFINDPKQ